MNDKYECLKLDSQLCFSLYACAKEITRIYKPYLDKIDLTYTQYVAMMVMWEEKEAKLKHIGTRLDLDSGTLTPLFKKLEEKGYVERIKDESDERNLILKLSKKGEELKEKAKDIPFCIKEQINLSEDELYNLFLSLKKMRASFK